MKFRSKKSEKEKSRNENNSSANARSIICCQWKNKRMDAEKTESPIRSARQANSKSMDIDLMNHVRHPLWIHSHGSTPPTGTESPVVQPLEDGTPTPLPFFHRKETPTITKSVKEKSAENSENQSRVSLPITLVKENSITYFKSKEGKTQTSAVRDIVVPSKPVVLTDLEQDTAEKKINDHFEPEAQLVISPAQSNYSKSYTVSPSVDLEIETESPNTTPKPTLRLPVSPKPRANIANKNADYALDKEVSKLTSQKEIASRNQDRSSRTNISRVNTMTPVSISGKENVTKLASPPVLIHCLEDTHTQISRVNSISPVPISDKEKTSTFVSDVDKMNHYVSEQNKHHMNPDMLKIGKDKPSASSNHRSENALPDNPRIVSTFFSKEEMTYASKFFDVKKLEKDQPKQKKRRQKIKKTKPAVSAISGKELKSIKKSNSCKASSVNENGKNHAFQNIARCKTFTSQHNKLGEFYNDDIPILKPNQKAKKIDIEETLVGIAYDDDNVKSRNRRTKPTDKEELKISTSKSVTFRPMSSENTSSSNEVKQSASNYPEKNTQTSTTSQNTIDSNFPLSVGSRSALREGTRFFMENETSVVKLNVSDEDSYSDGNDTYEELSESEISEGLTEDDEESENDTDSHTIKQMRSNPPSEYISTAMSVVYGDESGRESDPDRMLIANYDPYLDEDTD
ncbi:uncharacterized protein LOC128226914 [Mya arenaria]|uniref:uncharacterized protein LOC128226914 n=1 Tax=Mya arenaria TaxID=6604 RepID=UPI0022DECF52|nr:uncharacterized protein LOC128226914 [Mya arenaria]